MPEILSQHYRRRLVGATIAPHTHTVHLMAMQMMMIITSQWQTVPKAASAAVVAVVCQHSNWLISNKNAAAVPVEHFSLLAVMMMMAK